jgi:maltooligosyltrehalose trehalohydrolase
MHHRHAMPFGAAFGREATRFSLWAPSAAEVTLVLDGADHAMPAGGDGWYSLTLPDVRPGARYGYRVGDLLVPDPASRFQPDDVKGPSAVVDPDAFDWPDGGWRGRPWEEAVLYEVHVGTATPEGTFAALAEILPELAELGVTAVELMPIGEFHGRRNWGYDGVLPYAPDASYGSPEDLKRLVAKAHSLGLMIFLDVVYNHFGPVGNYLHAYAKTFFTERHETPWGAGMNVDGPDGKPVRDFFVENALYWLDEFQFDGLRLDAVHAIRDDSGDHLLAELARRARALAPDRHIHLVLENEHNESRWLERGQDFKPLLHTAQWNDDIHHCWHVLLTGERDSYYRDFADDPVGRLRRGLTEGFVYQGDPSPNQGGKPRGTPSAHLPPACFVAFLQNHDQVGNRAFGDRLAGAPERLALARAFLLLGPQIPMLFMGEEWGAATPFQFFVDFADDPELSRAVREGRRREFRNFPAFADEAAAARIPDPTDEATFLASKLAREEAARPPHDAVLAETRRLLALRRDVVAPLTASPYLGSEDRSPSGAIDVLLRYQAGTLRLAAQFAGDELRLPLTPREELLWIAPNVVRDSVGALFPSWSGVVTVERRA